MVITPSPFEEQTERNLSAMGMSVVSGFLWGVGFTIAWLLINALAALI